MSVIASQRNETKLAFLDHAEKLVAYTIGICSNEKHFPKRYRWCLTAKIVEAAVNVLTFASKANATYPTSKDDLRLRLRFIGEAIAEISVLISLIPVAAKMFQIDLANNSVAHWLETATYEKTLLVKWRNANLERLNGMPE